MSHMIVPVKTLTFKAYLYIFLIFFIVLLTVLFLFKGGNELFTRTTYVLTFALIIFFMLTLYLARDDLFVQVAVMTIFFLFYIFPRIFSYLAFPSLVKFPFGDNVSAVKINQGLEFVFWGTIMLFLGMGSAFVLSKRLPRVTRHRTIVFDKKPVFFFFLISIFVDLFITFWLGVGFLTKLRYETHNSLIQFIKLIFHVDVIFFMIFLIYLLHDFEEKKLNLRNYIFIFFVYVVYLALNGSRMSGFKILLIFTFMILYFFPNLNLKPKKFFVFFVTLGLISFLSYPLATQVRVKFIPYFFDKRGIQNGELLLEFRDFFNVSGSTDAGFELYAKPKRLLSDIMNRFGLLDYAVLTITEKPDSAAKHKYISYSYLGKSIVNTCLPGDPFPDAKLSTSRLLPVLYRGFSEQYVQTHGYFSELYTLWGISYLFWGWMGGLGALFMIGFLLEMAYFFIHSFCGPLRDYFGLYFLLVIFSYYSSMGLDHSITTTGILFTSLLLVIMGFYLFGLFFHRLPKYGEIQRSGECLE